MRSASEAKQDQVLCDQNLRRTKIKSCAISIRGEPRLSPVHSASEANQTIEKEKIQKNRKKEKIQKNQKKGKSKKKSKKEKKEFVLVVLDKICVYCLYPIPDSQ